MKWLNILYLCIALLLSVATQAQDGGRSSNLLDFTPSALFDKGQFEIQAFNSVYTQKQIRDREGNTIELGGRQQFFTSLLQFTYGVTNNARLNVGIDINFTRAVYYDSEGNAWDLLGSNHLYSRNVIAGIGPRIKFTPLESVPRLSFQSTLWIPISKEMEQPNFAAHDRYTWWTQIFFDRQIAQNFQVFLEAGALVRFKRYEAQRNFFRTPFSAFFSYFPSPKATVFAFAQHSPAYGRVYSGNTPISDFGRIRWFTQAGLGAKYQATPKLGLELSYGHFLASRSDGAGGSLNIGLRYIRR